MFIRSSIGPSKFVAKCDPSLNPGPEFDADHAKFLEDGDLKHLDAHKKPGEELTVFTVKPLSRKAFVRVTNIHGIVEQAIEAVAHGLTGVEGFKVGGAVLEVSSKDGRLTEQTLDALFDPVLFGELTNRIIEISRLHPTRG